MNHLERRPLRTRTHRWAIALAQGIARTGVTPNAISLAGVLAAALGAASVAVAGHAAPGPRAALFVGVAVCIQLRLLANLLDGMVAIEDGRATPTGPLFNDVPDRVADVLLLVAAGYVPGAPGGTALLGFAAALLAVVTAYVRTLGVTVGARADFSGPMAKPQRMALLTLAFLASAIESALGLPLRAMAVTLAIITLGCVVTAVRRLRTIAPPGGRMNTTIAVSDERMSPAPTSPSRGLGLAALKLVLATVGRLSEGVRTGWRTGFDSGVSLDYAYENTPRGTTLAGRWLDRRYLDAAGWRAVRRRRAALGARLESTLGDLVAAGRPAHVVDIAAGVGRYVLELIHARPDLGITAELRDRDPRSLAAGRALAARLGVRDAQFVEADAFDLAVRPSAAPTIAVVSGFYELFSDNALVGSSLRALHDTLAPGGVLLYTNQPWHPHLDLIARVLVKQDGQPWVMRCRSQGEMDGLVAVAGFRKVAMDVDEHGIFTVSMARKVDPA